MLRGGGQQQRRMRVATMFLTLSGVALTAMGLGVDKTLRKFVDVHDSRPSVETSIDGGKTWTPRPVSSDDVQDVISDPSGKLLVAVGEKKPAMVSLDSGNSWVEGKFQSGGTVSCYNAAVSEQGEVLLATCYDSAGKPTFLSVYASFDKGANWQHISASNVYGDQLSCIGTNGNGTIFAACNGHQLLVSNDIGVLWRASDQFTAVQPNARFAAVALDQTGRHIASAFVNEELTPNNFTYGFKLSSDFGMTWSTFSSRTHAFSCSGGNQGGEAALAMNPAGTIIYFAYSCEYGVIYRYDVAGGVVTSTNSLSRVWTDVFIDAAGTNIVAFSDDYYCSSDSGQTWMTCATL